VQARPFQIIAEGEDYLVVNKPPFLLVHPSKPCHEQTLWHYLRELLAYELVCGGQISIVNRLDRETSGVVLVATRHESARRFSQAMARREARKEYVALVWGWPAAEEWEVDAPLLRQGERQPSLIYLKQMVHPDGAPARTVFRVERRFSRPDGARFSVVEARPVTGRMHQIRVHLAHSGHAVVGDKIYGPDELCYLEFIETGWTPALAARLLLPRHALHSTLLEMPEHAPWRAEWPADWRNFSTELFPRGLKNSPPIMARQ
jgi:23S rRNA pseudouridine1911/1915/1917 synthase